MIYLKSALAGLLAVVAAIVVLPIVGIVIYSAIHSSQEGSVDWDPISLTHPSLLLWCSWLFVLPPDFSGSFAGSRIVEVQASDQG